MIELYLTKVAEDSEREQAGKLYARVNYKESMDISDMAQHMAEHNTAFSEGLILGVLTDFVKCVREQVLNGNTVKIKNLAIFKATVEANALDKLYDADQDKTVTASLGTMAEGAKTGPAVKTIKLLAQSTGEFTREELKKSAKFAWTDKAKAEIAAAKGGHTDLTDPTDSNSGNGGSGSGNGGNSGGSNSGGSGSITTGVAAPTIGGEAAFTTSTQVTMSGPDGAEIRYTTDGSTPTASSTLYTEPITVSSSVTLKAIAIKDGQSSEVTTKQFVKSDGGADDPSGFEGA